MTDTCVDRGRPPFVRPGCGHPMDDHSSGLKCRICGRECGIWCDLPGSKKGEVK